MTGLTGEITLTSPLPTLTTPITLHSGGAASLSLHRAATAPDFSVLTISSANVVIIGLTISGGRGVSGGGVLATNATLDLLDSVITGNNASSSGGGIFSSGGSLTLTRVTVSSNSAAGSGGGIYSSGSLQVIASTISGGNAAGSGGGIYHASGTAALRNTTVSGNSAGSGGGGVISAAGTFSMFSSTITANSAGTVGSGIARLDGTTAIRYSLIADNGTSDCHGAITSQGYNLIRAATCTISGDTATNQINVNPLLAALADNGGSTQTHALNPGSPALNVSGASGCEPADQRGTARPQAGTCDIGAFEVSSEPPPPPIVPVDVPLDGTVIRGKVMSRERVALPNVTVSVLNRPDITPILTHADGTFSLRVSGTSALTLEYAKSGYLSSQRHVEGRHEDYVWIDDVVLVQLDARTTVIDASNSTTIQVAQGSIVTDEDGARRATLIIPAGTSAQIVLPNGTTQPADTLTVRATEYTVGESGQDAMPGELPPTIAYTYAVEYSADEAMALGATSIEFSQPIYHYVENFIDFPVGTRVPMGFYDRRVGAWIGSENGRVVRIISISGGLAEIDSDGDSIADNNLPGLSTAERQQLALLYAPGETLFRAPIQHFTPWDCNWPAAPPPDAVPPNGDIPHNDQNNEEQCRQSGSIIGCESQILGESVSIVGSPFDLVYSSDRVPGRRAAYTLDIPLSGGSVPASLRGIRVQIDIAGRQFIQNFSPAPNQTTRFTWDGLDAFGRAVMESRQLTLRVGYVYQLIYTDPGNFAIAWGRISGIPFSARRGSLEIILWQDTQRIFAVPRVENASVAGWSFDVHHRYDINNHVLYRGDGTQQGDFGGDSNANAQAMLDTLAGNGIAGFSGDGGLATAARLSLPAGIAVNADGSVIIADYNNHRVRRIAPDGVITTIAGTGTAGYNGDDLLATTAHLNGPNGVAVTPDGSIIITEALGQRVRRVAPDGMITTIAGIGVTGFSGDEGLSVNAQLNNPNAPIVSADGTIFFADTGNHRIRSITPDDPRTPAIDSRIITVAGTGSAGFSGDGGLATAAQLTLPRDVALTPDGGMLIADSGNHRVRAVTRQGVISTIAGTGTAGYNGDGIAATAAQLNAPEGVAVTPGGAIVIIADTANHRLRAIDAQGGISTFTGTGSGSFSAASLPLGRAALNQPNELTFAPDGGMVVVDSLNNAVRRIEPGLPGASFGDLLIPSRDGTEVYRFNGSGRHLTTLDGITGATLLSFAYDSAGRLLSVTDADNNVTTITRTSAGVPISITAPYGQVTTLTVNATGLLTRITQPDATFVEMNYTADGLLTRFRDARANVTTFAYDSMGRLIRHTNAENGVTTLSNTGIGLANTTYTLTTPGNRTTTYNLTETLTARVRTITPPSGLAAPIRDSTSAITLTQPDGTVVTLAEAGDPRFGALLPFTASETITTPGGRIRTVTETRTATLSDPLNPFSITSMSQTVAINGRNHVVSYNGATRTFTLTSPVGRSATVVIDARGRMISEGSAGLTPVTYAYDVRGRIATISHGARVTTFAYNAAGYIASITDPLSRVTSYTYDSAGRLTTETLPGGRVIAYTYDANGNQTSVTPPGRTAHTLTYNALNLITAITPPDVVSGSDATTYSYNADRQLTQIALPDGRTIALGYDAGARLNTTTIARGTFTTTFSPTTGQVTAIAAPGGVNHAFTYDGALPLSETWSGAVAGSVSRTYDNDLRPATISVNGANPIAMTYDNDGYLTGAGALTLTYNTQHGLLTGTSLGTAPNAVVETYTYNGFGEETGYTAVRNGVTLLSVTTSRDALGRITTRTETIGGVTTVYGYGYDAAGRLSSVTRDGAPFEAYTYDANGNRLTAAVNGVAASGVYDAQDRVISYGTATYAHSAAGDRTTQTIGGATTTYAYDELGNLLSVGLPGGTTVSYTVDGYGRRIGRTVGADIRRYLWQDDLRLIAQLDGANAVVSRFVYANGVNVPEYMIRGGVTYRLITDHLGSVRLVVDVATGTIAQRIDYDTYGTVLNDSNPGFQPFGYAGGLYDHQTGLVRFGARDYDARIGRWTTKDPIGFAGGDTNLYAYVMNDPINNSDITGLGGTTSGGSSGYSGYICGGTPNPGSVIQLKKDANRLREQSQEAMRERDLERARRLYEEWKRRVYDVNEAQGDYQREYESLRDGRPLGGPKFQTSGAGVLRANP